jgi:anthranilate synthase/aminodeoxychorismate synthase-like glutamine amidotransferase
MFLLVDNYDSFTYNLVQHLGRLGVETKVLRNDACTVEDVRNSAAEAVVLSPGPGRPEDAGVCVPLVQALFSRLPIFGVCLGMQAIAAAFGGQIIGAQRPLHGKQAPAWHVGEGSLRSLPSPLTVCRYHSLVVDPKTLPPELAVTAWSAEGEVMALRHRGAPVEGLQFHPESAFTVHGIDILANFVAEVRGLCPEPPLPERREAHHV